MDYYYSKVYLISYIIKLGGNFLIIASIQI
jgi:hypothetical protein